MTPAPDVETLSIRGLWIVRRGDRRLIVKGGLSRGAAVSGIEREKTCLQVLRGLAVPKLVRLRPAETRELLPGAKQGAFLATELLEGYGAVDAVGLSTAELVAAWLFVVEQLVAFRRHQILYTDVKCGNVLARKQPFSVRVIDFEFCTVAYEDGRQLEMFGYTPAFEPPETTKGLGLTERSLVFQVAMLLPHTIAHAHRMSLRLPRRGLALAKQSLRAVGVPELNDVMEACLASDPSKRPGDLEELYERVQAIGLTQELRAAVEELRAPFSKQLAALGLGRPRGRRGGRSSSSGAR